MNDILIIEAIQMFADDTALIHKSVQQLQRVINKLSIWLSKREISFHYDKCVPKIFTLGLIEDALYLQMNGEILIWCSEALRYLGIRLCTKLTWSTHINSKLNEGSAGSHNYMCPLIHFLHPLISDIRVPGVVQCI